MTADGSAYDVRAQVHERSKDRAFAFAFLFGAAIFAGGIVCLLQGGLWILLGVFLMMLGAMFTFAAAVGYLYRTKARRALHQHAWVTAPIEVLAAPLRARQGRVFISVGADGHQLAITGLDEERIAKLGFTKQIEYAGDLEGTGMVFVRPLDADEIFIATVPHKKAPHPGAAPEAESE